MLWPLALLFSVLNRFKARNNNISSDTLPISVINGRWTVSEVNGADGRRDIYFQLYSADVPPSHYKLKNEIESTLSGIYIIYTSDKDAGKRDSAFNKLLALSQLGLVGPDPKTEAASQALKNLQDELIDREASRIKNSYLRKFGFIAFGLALPFICLSSVLGLFHPYDPVRDIWQNLGVMLASCMLGTWLSVASRKLNISFSDLVRIEDDNLEPSIRLIFTASLTFILAMMVYTGLINVSLGAFHASNWINSAQISIVFGALAGISEKTLPTSVLSQASRFIGSSERR